MTTLAKKFRALVAGITVVPVVVLSSPGTVLAAADIVQTATDGDPPSTADSIESDGSAAVTSDLGAQLSN